MNPVSSNSMTYGRGTWGSWNRFWFQPTDPTTLGLIRIITGLLVFYVTLAYSFDLVTFFGPQSWWDAKAADMERKEWPILTYPFGYEDRQFGIPLPYTHYRRDAVIKYLRTLPDRVEDRKQVLRYYTKELTTPLEIVEGMQFLASLAMHMEGPPNQRKDLVMKLLFPNPELDRRTEIEAPKFLVAKMPLEKEQIVQAILDFMDTMPPSLEETNAVIAYFMDYDPTVVQNWIMSLPEDRDERLYIINYHHAWEVDPRQVHSQGRRIFSFWFHITDPVGMWAIHIAVLVVVAMFTIGLWTRFTSVLTWILCACYIHRSQQILFGQDTMMNILLIYLMIGNSGAALSVDRLIARFKAARAIARNGGKPVSWATEVLAGPAKSWSANLAIRLIQVNFCFIYMSAGLAKLKGTTWWDHTAPWMTIANADFTPMNIKLYEEALRLFSQSRPLVMIVCTALSLFTLFLEIGFPSLVWTRMRPFMVACAAMFHMGIAVFMGLTLFGLFMLTMLLAYFPAALIRQRVCWSPEALPKLKLRFDSRDANQVRAMSTLVALDVGRQIECEDAATKAGAIEPIRLEQSVKKQVQGMEIFRGAFSMLPLLNSISLLKWPVSTLLKTWCFRGNTTNQAPKEGLATSSS